MNPFRLLFVFALLFTPLALAQTTRMVDGKLEVRGVVTSGTDHKPIVNATVDWLARRYQPRSITFVGIDVIGSTKSDDKGRFVLSGLPVPKEGAHSFVRATADGFAYGSVMYRNGPGEDHRFGVGEAIEDANGVTVELEKESSIVGVVVDEYELHGFLYADDGPQLLLGLSPRTASGDALGIRAMVTFRGMNDDLKVEPGETLDGLDFEFTEGARATLKAVKREKE